MLKTLEDRAEEESRQRAARNRVVRFEDFEDDRRRDDAQHCEAPNPRGDESQRDHAKSRHSYCDYGTRTVDWRAQRA
ncbi:MAG: hypothetical protein AMXMBFR57_22760 [Acidimicrobiia bacterium]